MKVLGRQLETLCRSATHELVLVAPFMKANTLKRVLAAATQDVLVKCVTRWRPDEIVAGVSDLEVWHIINERSNTELWLRSDLHAKYYRADQQCLVGSANLTMTALGWSASPNLEILIELPAMYPELNQFEGNLFQSSIQVDDNLFKYMQQTIETLKQHSPQVMPEVQLPFPQVAEQVVTDEAWIPTLRNPADLYLAYSGKIDDLTSASKEAALADLAKLPIMKGLQKEIFELQVGILILQKPIVKQVDTFVATQQRFGAVSRFLAGLPCADQEGFDSNRAWQALMRWLLHFLPNRYYLVTPHHSEVFGRLF